MSARIPSQIGDPAWEVARFFPPQGQWREADYFRIHTNQLVELVAGKLEVLPMPTWLHQLIVDFLLTLIKEHLKSNNIPGTVLFAPLGIRPIKTSQRTHKLRRVGNQAAAWRESVDH